MPIKTDGESKWIHVGKHQWKYYAEKFTANAFFSYDAAQYRASASFKDVRIYLKQGYKTLRGAKEAALRVASRYMNG